MGIKSSQYFGRKHGALRTKHTAGTKRYRARGKPTRHRARARPTTQQASKRTAIVQRAPQSFKIAKVFQEDIGGLALQLVQNGAAGSKTTFFCEPRKSRIRPILESRGWTWVQSPDEASLIWYQKKTHIKWKSIKPWQIINHFQKESEIGHKGRLTDLLIEVSFCCFLFEACCCHRPTHARMHSR